MHNKVKGGKWDTLAHSAIIRMIVLETLGNMRYRVPWVDLLDMEK
jgi:hypothetical protein